MRKPDWDAYCFERNIGEFGPRQDAAFQKHLANIDKMKKRGKRQHVRWTFSNNALFVQPPPNPC